ncbi:potassium channel family protein [Lactococcus petauri]|uniref:potassium channel family protein n=1 Tax=Lactococcus petauri TaxID=1940789 RepID=UPI001786C426|nr:potassium channel family protein [Lactococcus petauri]MBD5823133.1 two pore domain potassium channel family protein [Lactococcus petauri]
MLSLLIATKKLFTSFSFILKKDDTKALFFLMATTLMSGTIFYSTVEKFSILDALYLSFMTLTTIGYGDLHPITTTGKIFTMIYATVGLGIMAMFISVISKAFIYSKQKHKE